MKNTHYGMPLEQEESWLEAFAVLAALASFVYGLMALLYALS